MSTAVSHQSLELKIPPQANQTVGTTATITVANAQFGSGAGALPPAVNGVHQPIAGGAYVGVQKQPGFTAAQLSPHRALVGVGQQSTAAGGGAQTFHSALQSSQSQYAPWVGANSQPNPFIPSQHAAFSAAGVGAGPMQQNVHFGTLNPPQMGLLPPQYAMGSQMQAPTGQGQMQPQLLSGAAASSQMDPSRVMQANANGAQIVYYGAPTGGASPSPYGQPYVILDNGSLHQLTPSPAPAVSIGAPQPSAQFQFTAPQTAAASPSSHVPPPEIDTVPFLVFSQTTASENDKVPFYFIKQIVDKLHYLKSKGPIKVQIYADLPAPIAAAPIADDHKVSTTIKICDYAVRNKPCPFQRGVGCKFSHDVSTQAKVTKGLLSYAARNTKITGICRFLAQPGGCRFGIACRNPHPSGKATTKDS